jgi:hypothetical protein
MTTLKNWQIPDISKRNLFLQQSISTFAKTVSEKGFDVEIGDSLGLNVVGFKFKSEVDWNKSKIDLKDLHSDLFLMQHWQVYPFRMVVIFKTES